MELMNQVENIIKKYEGIRTKDKKSSNPKVKKMLSELETSLKEVCIFDNIKIKARLGAGNLPKTPVVYFKDSRLSTSGTTGLYVALVIIPKGGEHKGHFDIVLTQGVEAELKKQGKEEAKKYLSAKAVKIAQKYQTEIAKGGFETFLTDERKNASRIFQTSFPSTAKISDKKFADKLNTALAIYVDIAEAKELEALADGDVEVQKAVKNLPNRVTRSILERRGQPEFRKKLLKLYNTSCLMTGCNVEAALEAAHIVSVKDSGNMSPDNGILLRSDIHTLFDLQLVQISTDGKVTWDESLKDSEYAKQYKSVSFPYESESRDNYFEERLTLLSNANK